MPKKSSSKREERGSNVNDMSMDAFDAAIQETAQSFKDTDEIPAGTLSTFFIPALLMAGLPIYLFISPMFDMSLKEDAATFGGVTLLCAFLLAKSYHKVASANLTQYLKIREPAPSPTKAGRAQNQADFDKNCRVEAMSYSLFINNIFFVLLFLTLSFWFIPKLPVVMPKNALYSASVVGPAALIFAQSHKYITI